MHKIIKTWPLVRARIRIRKGLDKRQNRAKVSRHRQQDLHNVAYSSWDPRHNRWCASMVVVWSLGKRRACSTHMLNMATLTRSSNFSSRRMAQWDRKHLPRWPPYWGISPIRNRSTFSLIRSRQVLPLCFSNKPFAHSAHHTVSPLPPQQQIRAVKRFGWIE